MVLVDSKISMSNPKDLKFATTHEWLRILNNNEVEVGISDYAVNLLTDITYIELPDEGDSFSVGDSFGEVESVKAASEIYSPVDGEVSAVNKNLDTLAGLEQLSKDPYGKGWLIRMKLEAKINYNKLLSYEEYQEHIKKESH